MIRLGLLLGFALLLVAACSTGAGQPDDAPRVTADDVRATLDQAEADASVGTTADAAADAALPATAGDDDEPADPVPEEPATPAAMVDAAEESSPPPEPPIIDLRIADPSERARLTAALTAAGFALLPADAAPSNADVILSDAPLRRDEAVHIDSWAANVHQRHNVLDLDLDPLRAALTGAFPTWSSFGGDGVPLTVFLPQTLAPRIRRGLRLPNDTGAVLPLDELIERVRTTPGALAIVPLHALRPGLLPLVINGHDPLRDPAAASPLRLERWLRAPDDATRARVLAALGWTHAPDGDPLGLIATGDYIPVRCVPDAVRVYADNDFTAVFASVGERLRRADAAIVSMEVSLVPEEFVTPCLETFILSAPVAAADALASAGVDVVTLAGNHAADCYGGCGRATALASTIRVLEARGIAHAGTGVTLADVRRPALIERDGVRIAVLSYEGQAADYFATDDTPGVAPLREDILRADIAAARAVADHVIVAFSSGVEYVTTTLRQQDDAVRIAMEAGATLVIGNHPHAIQPLVELNGAIAAFALGNFVFDQDWSAETTQSILLEAGFRADGLIGYRVRPVVIRHNHRPETVDPAGPQGRQILTRLWDASDAWLARNPQP